MSTSSPYDNLNAVGTNSGNNGLVDFSSICERLKAETEQETLNTIEMYLSHITTPSASSPDSVSMKRMPDWIKRAAPMAHSALQKLGAGNEVISTWSLQDVADILFRSYTIPREFAETVHGLRQRSALWFRLRGGWVNIKEGVFRAPLITSSVVGKILGHQDGYVRDDQKVLLEQLYPEITSEVSNFGIAAMQRGTAMEPCAMDMTKLVLYRDVTAAYPKAYVQLKEVGLAICVEEPYMGYSVDSEITFVDPDSQQCFTGAMEIKNRPGEDMPPYPIIKEEYYDQCQHAMALKRLPEYTFVCHSAPAFAPEHYKYDAEAWERHFQTIQEYYWRKLWPRIVLKALGLIVYPQLLPSYETISHPVLRNLFLSKSDEEEVLLRLSSVVAGFQAQLKEEKDAKEAAAAAAKSTGENGIAPPSKRAKLQ